MSWERLLVPSVSSKLSYFRQLLERDKDAHRCVQLSDLIQKLNSHGSRGCVTAVVLDHAG